VGFFVFLKKNRKKPMGFFGFLKKSRRNPCVFSFRGEGCAKEAMRPWVSSGFLKKTEETHVYLAFVVRGAPKEVCGHGFFRFFLKKQRNLRCLGELRNMRRAGGREGEAGTRQSVTKELGTCLGLEVLLTNPKSIWGFFGCFFKKNRRNPTEKLKTCLDQL